MDNRLGSTIHITGVVQGVGFRPFVFSLANRLELHGWVRNTSSGVEIEVNGPRAKITEFIDALHQEAPPLARIDSLQTKFHPPDGSSIFEIKHSKSSRSEYQPISPDVSICVDCLQELFDPEDPRYRYPFINCTNCGPRFTIIKDIPYDRQNTTMASFEMCTYCAWEYEDPSNRRFHAQPVACPRCGPKVWLELSGMRAVAGGTFPYGERAISQTRDLLAGGKIIAIKGLGGFHLACDATNPWAVSELRRRKLRRNKPFALMMPDMEAIEKHCKVNEKERELLLSRERPVVLLWRKEGSPIALEVAPGQKTLGVMLPYTPLHYLLLERAPEFSDAFVMTSGNLSNEPIAYKNAEARRRLATLADAFLMHDREIHIRTDDSVMGVIKDASDGPGTVFNPYPIRRSRGYAPIPILLPVEYPPTLATGADLKNTFCITRDRNAFLSQHIGDMENYETNRSFESSIEHFERLFRINPQILAYDLHPDYLTTRYAINRAKREGLIAFSVQHHHAHIVACLAENNHPGDHPVIGVSLDGTGYGPDKAIWGGEFILADFKGYQRIFHLAYVRLPGGDTAIHEPWRMALAWLNKAGIEWKKKLPPVQYAINHNHYGRRSLYILQHQLQSGLNAPLTSSMGRLFDAVSALIGIQQKVNYEAQAAMELEMQVDPHAEGTYPFTTNGEEIDPAPMFHSIVQELENGVNVPIIASRFHNTIAEMIFAICNNIQSQSGITEIALSGGVWQNKTLLEKTLLKLHNQGFTVYTHKQVPTNDGGLAFGQAVVAASQIKT